MNNEQLTVNNNLIEMQIITAIREMLTGRVNEILSKSPSVIPIIEFGDFGCGYGISPVIVLTACERTEKERIVRLDAYSVSITFPLPDITESELHCYVYSGAVSRAIYDNPTLGGIVDRAVITGKKYVSPKKPNCGEGWGLVISLRVTVEGE